MSDEALYNDFRRQVVVLKAALRDALVLLDDLNSMAREEWLSEKQQAENAARMAKWESLL